MSDDQLPELDTPTDEPDDFKGDLIQEDEQWWHFLDHEKPEEEGTVEGIDPGSGELELQDVGGPSHTGTGFRPSAHSFRCSHCRGENPADIPFCVHCGSKPRRHLHARTDLFVIGEPADDLSREYLAEVFAQGAPNLDADEIAEMLDDPPAFLLVSGHPRPLDSLFERVDELGADVRTMSPNEPDREWHREIAESILRDTRQVAIFSGVAVMTVAAMTLFSALVIFLGVAAGWSLFNQRRDWYRDRYALKAEPVLEAVSGLSSDAAGRARRLLKTLAGSDAQNYLSVCLMEYYAIWHRLAPKGSVSDALLQRARNTARELIDHVLRCSEDYAEIWKLLETRGDGATARTVSENRERLEQTERKLRQQLSKMAKALESLRSRTVAVTTDRRQAGAETKLEGLVSTVEDELEVVGETLDVLQRETIGL